MSSEQTTGEAGSGSASLFGRIRRLREELKAQANGMARLWMLESQLALQTGVRMLSLAVAAAVLAVTAWLFTALAIGVFVVARFAHPEVALLVLAIVNGGLAWLVWRSINRLADRGWFPATRRRLAGQDAGIADDGVFSPDE